MCGNEGKREVFFRFIMSEIPYFIVCMLAFITSQVGSAYISMHRRDDSSDQCDGDHTLSRLLPK